MRFSINIGNFTSPGGPESIGRSLLAVTRAADESAIDTVWVGDHLIQAVTSLDVLSGGRAWFGIGAGYHETEARAMGLPLPPATERFERLEETLWLVATYTDACNLFDVPGRGDLVRRKLDVLAGHCQAVGRPFGEIEKTMSSRLEAGETPAAVAARCAAFADLSVGPPVTH